MLNQEAERKHKVYVSEYVYIWTCDVLCHESSVGRILEMHSAEMNGYMAILTPEQPTQLAAD